VLPVSQDIEHGPLAGRSRSFRRAWAEAFDAVVGQAIVDATVGFRDRRYEQRRYRPTNNEKMLEGPQEPYSRAPVDPDAFRRGW
jgi:hypothetical protein